MQLLLHRLRKPCTPLVLHSFRGLVRASAPGWFNQLTSGAADVRDILYTVVVSKTRKLSDNNCLKCHPCGSVQMRRTWSFSMADLSVCVTRCENWTFNSSSHELRRSSKFILGMNTDGSLKRATKIGFGGGDLNEAT